MEAYLGAHQFRSSRRSGIYFSSDAYARFPKVFTSDTIGDLDIYSAAKWENIQIVNRLRPVRTNTLKDIAQ